MVAVIKKFQMSSFVGRNRSTGLPSKKNKNPGKIFLQKKFSEFFKAYAAIYARVRASPGSDHHAASSCIQ